MSWLIDKSIKRVFNAFKRNKNNIWQEDIEALKLINLTLLEAQKTAVNNNLLFAKLLSIQIRQNLVYYGCIKMALKVVIDDIKKPLNYNLTILQKELNTFDYFNYLESIGIKKDDSISSVEINKKIIEQNQSEMVEKILTNWNFETVETSFYRTANQIIKDLDSYS